MKEYAFFTNFPTPQKVDLFNRLSERLEGRVVFFFYTSSVPKRRGWEDSIRRAVFRYEILKTSRFRTSVGFGSDEAYAFVPRGVPKFSRFRKVVVSGGLTPSELYLGLKALASGVPYIVWTGAPSLSFGGWWGIPYRAFLRFFIFSNAEAVVAATGLAAEHSKRLGAKRVVVAYTTFDTGRFKYEKEHRGRCPHLLFTGRLIKVKRIPDLIRAISMVPKVHLDIVGEGPLRDELENVASGLGVYDRLRFIGKVEYGRMPSLYRKYDVLVLPSHWEVFGFVVVEALMSSVAALVSSGVGAKDFLPEHAIFPVGDVKRLSQMLEGIKDPSVRNRIVRYAQRKIEELATPERWADTFARLMEG